jgi:hypothetical protein
LLAHVVRRITARSAHSNAPLMRGVMLH